MNIARKFLCVRWQPYLVRQWIVEFDFVESFFNLCEFADFCYWQYLRLARVTECKLWNVFELNFIYWNNHRLRFDLL